MVTQYTREQAETRMAELEEQAAKLGGETFWERADARADNEYMLTLGELRLFEEWETLKWLLQP